MESYNTHPNPYKKHLSSEEVLKKRLQNIGDDWPKYAKVLLLAHGFLLFFLFTLIVTVKFALTLF